MKAPLPANEAARLAALRRLEILDTAPEQCFDDITFLASQICGTPISLITLIDGQRQWFKSCVGMPAAETPRDQAFCAHAILQPNEILVVPDALADPRFANNPLVTDDPGIRFYAGAPLLAPDGNALGTLCVIDRQERALTPQQLTALGALARQVNVLLNLRALAHTLETERARAEAATQAKAAFLASMSHEIRTPMNGVLGAAHLLERSELPVRARELVGLISQSGTSLLSLIDDILDFSKLEAGKLRVLREPFVLEGTANQSLALLRPRAQAKGLQLEHDFSPQLTGRWLGDSQRVGQVLLNLLSNAIKFTAKGSVRLRVEPTTVPEGAWVRFSVIDSSIGLNPAEQARLFEPFSQAHVGRPHRCRERQRSGCDLLV
jgi:signal transduction histidine kinase